MPTLPSRDLWWHTRNGLSHFIYRTTLWRMLGWQIAIGPRLGRDSAISTHVNALMKTCRKHWLWGKHPSQRSCYNWRKPQHLHATKSSAAILALWFSQFQQCFLMKTAVLQRTLEVAIFHYWQQFGGAGSPPEGSIGYHGPSRGLVQLHLSWLSHCCLHPSPAST